MKRRLQKKLLKKQNTTVNITNVICGTSTMCIVRADRYQLDCIGIDLELTDCEVEYLKDYRTGYSQIRIERKELTELLGKKMFEHYDIPKKWLEFKD